MCGDSESFLLVAVSTVLKTGTIAYKPRYDSKQIAEGKILIDTDPATPYKGPHKCEHTV